MVKFDGESAYPNVVIHLGGPRYVLAGRFVKKGCKLSIYAHFFPLV